MNEMNKKDITMSDHLSIIYYKKLKKQVSKQMCVYVLLTIDLEDAYNNLISTIKFLINNAKMKKKR